MKYTIDIYLSSRNDKDLIALYQNIPKKVFYKAIKEALRLAIRPGYYTDFFKLLKPDPSWEAKILTDGSGIKIKDISVASEKDEDVREMLAAVKPGRCSGMVKMALRFALGARYVVGNSLYGDDYINSVVGVDNMFYIQKAPTKVIYKTVKSEKKEVKEEKPKEEAKVVKEEPKEEVKTESTFSLSGPGMELSFGNENTNSNSDSDDFSDDDILSMLDGM